MREAGTDILGSGRVTAANGLHSFRGERTLEQVNSSENSYVSSCVLQGVSVECFFNGLAWVMIFTEHERARKNRLVVGDIQALRRLAAAFARVAYAVHGCSEWLIVGGVPFRTAEVTALADLIELAMHAEAVAA